MKTTIYVPDIECESCSKLIGKKLQKKEGVTDFQVKEDSVEIEHTDKVRADELVKSIQDADFRASLEPFERKTFKERLRDIKENKKKYALEKTGIKYATYTFIILFALEALAYMGFLNKIPNFLAHYGIWIVYSNIGIVAIGFALWHLFSYKIKVTCMVGMMIGMTIGMQIGMMIGAVIGATNGFFIGAMTGMVLGVIVGSIAGKTCGIMGIMEGMMAGLMGGTMGPMISIMMFSDHLQYFMPVFMAVNVLILAGLSYMIFEEMVEHKKSVQQPVEFGTFAAVCIIATFVIILIMIYAPKSALVSFG
jgi:copper chaperone CopZ